MKNFEKRDTFENQHQKVIILVTIKTTEVDHMTAIDGHIMIIGPDIPHILRIQGRPQAITIIFEIRRGEFADENWKIDVRDIKFIFRQWKMEALQATHFMIHCLWLMLWIQQPSADKYCEHLMKTAISCHALSYDDDSTSFRTFVKSEIKFGERPATFILFWPPI